MLEAADFSNGNDKSEFGWLHRSRFRGVFSQREVRPAVVIIRDKTPSRACTGKLR
jgi:hypothetical protein